MKKAKTFLKENYKILIFMLCLLIMNCFLVILSCGMAEITVPSKKFIFLFIFQIIISVALCVFIFFAKAKKWKIENIFLVIGSVLGMLFLLAIPIGRTPDEPAHFWRAFSIAQGQIFHNEEQDGKNGVIMSQDIAAIGNGLVENAYQQTLDNLLTPLSDEQSFKATANSNPLFYIPHIIGILIGLLLHLPPLLILYLARLIGLACFIAIIYFCIKYIPILKKSLFFIACFPLTLQSLVGISCDGIIFCAATALITLVLYSVYHPNFRFKLYHYLLILAAFFLLIAAKPVYAPLCLLSLFILSYCFGAKKKKIITLILIFGFAIMSYFMWSALYPASTPENNAAPSEQISFILSHPGDVATILFNNAINMPATYIQRAFTFEWLDLGVPVGQIYMVFILVFFILICVSERLSGKLKQIKFFRLFCGLSFACMACLIFLAMFINWSTPGSGIIEGVQSRYFLPILILLPLMCLIPSKEKTTTKPLLNDLCIYGVTIFFGVHVLSTIICSHL